MAGRAAGFRTGNGPQCVRSAALCRRRPTPAPGELFFWRWPSMAGCTRICSYHPGVVGRYFSVTLGKDLYGQSEDGSCLGMLQGSVEHLIHVGEGTF